jgi:hypothetical protein
MWALWLLIPAGGLVALLAVPADVSLEVEREERLRVRLGFRWLFVRLRHELDPTTLGRSGERKPRKEKAKPAGMTRSIRSIRRIRAAGRVPGLWKAARRFLRRAASSVRPVEVAGRLRVGIGDPAETGRLWALAAPAALWLARRPWSDVTVEPDFSGAGVTGTLGGTLRLYPGRLVYAVLSTVLSPTAIRLALAVARNR